MGREIGVMSGYAHMCIRRNEMDLLLRLYKAVAYQKRIDMLALLLKHKEMALEEIYTALGISQTTASRNLKILERAKFVSSTYKNGRVFYSIVNTNDLHYNKAILELIEKWEKGARQL
jgi:DNA-binding transcriptional ArsR family regulator